MKPLWNPDNKQASIRKWAESLHMQSKEVFLKDKTHAQLLFFFKDEGPVGINPIPPKTNHAQVYGAVRAAVEQHNLYAVIHVGEAWTYFLKGRKDHTAFQLLDGEMGVADLRQEDKVEALYLRMESRDGACVVYWDQIIRNGQDVTLGEKKILNNEERKWFPGAK